MATVPTTANEYDPLALDTEPEPELEPASTDPASTEQTPTAGDVPAPAPCPYARRRRRYKLAALAATITVLGLGHPWTFLSDGAPPVPAAVAQEAQPPAKSSITSDMTAVHTHLKDGDLSVIKLDGARVASAGTTVLVSRVTDAGCVVYGVIAGKDIATQADTSGAACTDAQVAAVQKQLDASDKATRSASVAGADQALAQAAKTALFHASRTFDAGQHTFTGLTSLPAPSVAVSANHGDWIELHYTGSGTCRSSMLALDGRLSPSQPC